MMVLLYLGTSKKFKKASSSFAFSVKDISSLVEITISHCAKSASTWQSVVSSIQELSELETRFVMYL